MTDILRTVLNEQEQAGVQLWAAKIALDAHLSVSYDGGPHACNTCLLLADRVKVWRIKRDNPGEA